MNRFLVSPLFRSLFFPVLLIAVTACNGPARKAKPANPKAAGLFGPEAPEWVRSGKVRGYPTQLFITGFGYSPRDLDEADALDQAKLSAFNDISNQIDTFVSNEFTSIMRSVFHNETVDEHVDLKSVSKQVSKEVLAGVEVARRYYDPATGTACVFAALERAKFGRRLLEQARAARASVEGSLQAYEGAKKEKNLSEALKNLVRARGALDGVRRARLKAIAVRVPEGILQSLNELDDPELSARVTRDLGTIENRVRMAVVSGADQRATLTGCLLEPVVVEVRMEGGEGAGPLAAFPVRVDLRRPGQAVVVPSGDTTDARGRFSFRLEGMKPGGKGLDLVTVRLDFHALAPDILSEGPGLEVRYFMPTRDNTRVGVVILETVDGKERSPSIVAGTIKKALAAEGFQMIRVNTELPTETVVTLPQAELVKRFRNACDYLVVGTAEARLSSRDFGLTWYYTRLSVDAVELDTAKTIHFEVPAGQASKGGDKNPEKAWRKSLARAAGVLTGTPGSEKPGLLVERFVARFDRSAKWSQ